MAVTAIVATTAVTLRSEAGCHRESGASHNFVPTSMSSASSGSLRASTSVSSCLQQASKTSWSSASTGAAATAAVASVSAVAMLLHGGRRRQSLRRHQSLVAVAAEQNSSGLSPTQDVTYKPPKYTDWERHFKPEVTAETEDDMAINISEGFATMPREPLDGVREDEKEKVYGSIIEGIDDVSEDTAPRPSGQSKDPDKIYFWKMSQDKKSIEVIVPVEDYVTSKDVICRWGEDPADPVRGPTLQLGHRIPTEGAVRPKENLIIDGTILNAVMTQECFWSVEEIAGVNVILLTIMRPRMMRWQHDLQLGRKTLEERIDPQTWDSLLLEERLKPEITEKVFMDISIKGEAVGKIEFGLYGDLLPRTVKNFIGLCTGEYVDDEGNTQKSTFCYKGTEFDSVAPDFLLSAGNPGLDHVALRFTHEELVDYEAYFGTDPAEEGDLYEKVKHKVKQAHTLRWGLDLGLGMGTDGRPRKEGDALDGNSEEERYEVCLKLKELVDKGEGAQLVFYRPEWEKGCDCTGYTFISEGFKAAHRKRGMLSMDRSDIKDTSGSVFFIVMKEFPQMDKKWTAFGEVTEGWDVIDRIEEMENQHKQVKITDCGIVA
eukprot:TRINITY_DN12634_c1_g1_i1.p1 TRINITY_DN12634_c1_g1~~TRINITY_DN12634_c1_g1_i1.p1  ORF type:complete len:647 (-),score=115.32 TRINITY_DN12634_c1_g1_i1:104-1909(-)